MCFPLLIGKNRLSQRGCLVGIGLYVLEEKRERESCALQSCKEKFAAFLETAASTLFLLLSAFARAQKSAKVTKK